MITTKVGGDGEENRKVQRILLGKDTMRCVKNIILEKKFIDKLKYGQSRDNIGGCLVILGGLVKDRDGGEGGGGWKY